MIRGLRCTSCETAYPLEPLYECKQCGSILKADYDYERIGIKWAESGVDTEDLLPLPAAERVSIGEGNTPLVRADRLAKRLGLRHLFLKCEFANPSGAFKDRPVSMGVSMAVKFGYDRIIVASSGNGAAATSAFAARAGLEAVVLVPESTPQEKVKQSLAYGARVVKVEGPYSNSFAVAKEIGEKYNMFNVTSTFINPYTVEGDKNVAFELHRQLKNVPDVIYVPIGAGPLLVGIFNGYEELKRLGVTGALPRMAGIQAEGCSPIARAYLEGRDQVQSDPSPRTIAGGICDGLHGYAKDGTYTLETILRSGGFANCVSDEEIRAAQSWLAQDEGMFVEPSSAVSIAELVHSVKAGRVKPDSVVVAVLTGHGLKDMTQVQTEMNAPLIPNRAGALADLLGV
ncbi:threonine synthase [Paenibacillus sp. MSJ-34]|uniref:threonine synthase n=1 Tax=Paenibacillus sp. MSJ-34 TaxID=2841529 RepID=UPI001C119AA6|nr:threonine synthase [Paenibacillus sp. MSJ-34]MBU5442186.1 threonine synthase [Paenibacillus sp. MSJ-34]